MTNRVRDAEELVRQREKLAALGKLSAGLAHELNNPASAVLRSVQQLQSNLTVERELYREITDIWADTDARRHAEEWVEKIEARLNPPPFEGTTKALPPPSDSPIEKNEREDRLITWMEANSVRDPWQIAPALAESRIEPADLDALASGTARVDLTTVLAWATAALTVDAMVHTAQQSAKRVTELVSAIKTYSHMDESDYQESDIHDGLESTLTILSHKLGRQIAVRREYDRSLPPIGAYGRELNQVWTNLIDNAIDALDGEGEITLRTSREGEYVLVEVIDYGSGISDEILPRIFDPFFTTKAVGSGTGLGLEIAHQIVVRHHNGDIRAVSENGETRFEVRLPFRQPGR
jgi:signal transduction histidine kinase